MTIRIPIPAPAERRIRREARSATLRELALAMRRSGWTLARIGEALDVSMTRASQIVRKAEREAVSPKNEPGAPARERPIDFDSNDPVQTGRKHETSKCVIPSRRSTTQT